MGLPTYSEPPSDIPVSTNYQWREAFADYPPADGWTVKYDFRIRTGDATANKLAVDGVADGDGFTFSIEPDKTAGLAPGLYDFAAYAENDPDRVRVALGSTILREDLAAVAGSRDARSHIEKTLANINAVLEDRATVSQKSYQIEGRRLDRIEQDKLLELKTKYENYLRLERAAAGVSGGGRNIQVRS